VVAHNLEFDEAVTRAEACRLGRELPFDERARFCTMKSTKDLCRIPFPSGRGYKYPTLAELHQACFGRPHKRAHDAVGDVDAAVSVVQHLIAQGFIQHAPGDPVGLKPPRQPVRCAQYVQHLSASVVTSMHADTI